MLNFPTEMSLCWTGKHLGVNRAEWFHAVARSAIFFKVGKCSPLASLTDVLYGSHSRKNTGDTDNINGCSGQLSVPVSHDSEPDCASAGTWNWLTWNAAIINIINYTCVFPTMMCQNVYSEKGSIEQSLLMTEVSNERRSMWVLIHIDWLYMWRLVVANRHVWCRL